MTISILRIVILHGGRVKEYIDFLIFVFRAEDVIISLAATPKGYVLCLYMWFYRPSTGESLLFGNIGCWGRLRCRETGKIHIFDLFKLH